jgi:hypothetical protein
MYNIYEITSSAHSVEQLREWFQRRGHMVTHTGPASIVVRMEDGKLSHVMRSNDLAGAEAELVKAYSEPVGLVRGEWVVMLSVGVAGRIAHEHGNANTPATSANVTVGSATWSAPHAAKLVRVSGFDEATAAAVIALGEQQAEHWQGVEADVATRQRLLDLLPVAAIA